MLRRHLRPLHRLPRPPLDNCEANQGDRRDSDQAEHQRDPELHDAEQDRVVVGAGVARRADVTTEVEPVRETAAGELGDERKQDQRQTREGPLMASCPVHVPPKVCASRRV